MILSVVFDIDRRRRADYFETISAHEIFDIARGIADGVALDAGGDVNTNIESDITASFVGVVDSIRVVATQEIVNRERINVVDLVDAVSIAEIEKKNSDFKKFLSVVSDCFSDLL